MTACIIGKKIWTQLALKDLECSLFAPNLCLFQAQRYKQDIYLPMSTTKVSTSEIQGLKIHVTLLLTVVTFYLGYSFIQDFVDVEVEQGFTHINFQAWLVSVSNSCFIISLRFVQTGISKKAGNMRHEYLQFGKMTTSPSQLLSLQCSSRQVEILKILVFSQPDFRHLPPPSRSWTQLQKGEIHEGFGSVSTKKQRPLGEFLEAFHVLRAEAAIWKLLRLFHCFTFVVMSKNVEHMEEIWKNFWRNVEEIQIEFWESKCKSVSSKSLFGKIRPLHRKTRLLCLICTFTPCLVAFHTVLVVALLWLVTLQISYMVLRDPTSISIK